MKIFNLNKTIAVAHKESFYTIDDITWDELLNQPMLFSFLLNKIQMLKPVADLETINSQEVGVPMGSQEVWAAGVTYLRSKLARMEESEESGGATFYDKVYDAERPELFFKANAHRVIPSGGKVRIRKDSSWNVPEPELVLVVNASGSIVGYTIGNDMSSRSIEGENPLYLPQAKVYDGSAAIGPCVLVREEEDIDPATGISIEIRRNEKVVYAASTSINQMKRKHAELVDFLYREYSFPQGAFLMTGTCLVPDEDFTLNSGDAIAISIDGIGTLQNTVA
ncbi:fumarylacetoacetate hydrolase family protein [Niabella insulamsoli]|uniref:fumarylacetoacetate hydrolase family protein n=1 Tax=Niabella insulamsoli TaxID=3144874 RepID=UPI0031FBE20A